MIVLKVTFIGFLVTIVTFFLLDDKEVSRTILIVYLIVSIILFTIEKTFLFYIAPYVRRKGINRKNVILIGTGTRASNFIDTVRNNFDWGLDIVGLLTGDYDNIGKEVMGIKILDHYNNIQHILKTVNPEEIIITISTKRFNQIRDVLEICEREGVTVRLNSDFFGHITKHVTVDNVFGLNIITFNMVKQSELEFFIKRVMDIIGSLIALLIFSPVMLIASLGIIISDGFPIFYSFIGYGYNKKPIKIIKFRTMVKNSEEIRKSLLPMNEMKGPVFKIKDDPRILPFGKWLRRFSIDETPQLISVLKGEMSLVGPRQAMKEELDKYESWQRRRLSVKSGLTCLWQVNGRNKISNFNEWTKLDLQYIDNWSIWLDIKILLKTILIVLLGKGV
jgi:exopolysaccharide biosynthesis polyprenyl glycosylphosphotransferase